MKKDYEKKVVSSNEMSQKETKNQKNIIPKRKFSFPKHKTVIEAENLAKATQILLEQKQNEVNQ